VTYVEGSWIVPSVSCTTSGTGAVLIWVGIDGFDNHTVEQVGVKIDCETTKPIYSAWYEYWNRSKSIVPIDTVEVRQGDAIGASVAYASGLFHMTLIDLRNGESFTNSSSYPIARENSAEWIVESPVFTNHTRLVMPDFGSVTYQNDFNSSLWRNYAIINGSAIGLDSSHDLIQSTYVCPNGDVKAAPANLSPDAQSFSISWEANTQC
jgi:hypothetical protein